MAERRRVLLIGPGAIGATVAGAIATAGHDVVIAARTPFSRLIVETPVGQFEPNVTVLTGAAAAGGRRCAAGDQGPSECRCAPLA